MSQPTTASGGTSVSLVALAAILVGLAVVGYGVVLLPTSVLGGMHIALTGLSLLLAGLFALDWVADRLGLSAATQEHLAVAFTALAVVLLVLFVVINFASFDSGTELTSGWQRSQLVFTPHKYLLQSHHLSQT